VKQDLLFAEWQIKPIFTIIGPYTTLKNKEKAITLNWINSAVKLGSLRIDNDIHLHDVLFRILIWNAKFICNVGLEVPTFYLIYNFGFVCFETNKY
jgi:hypothetical protein